MNKRIRQVGVFSGGHSFARIENIKEYIQINEYTKEIQKQYCKTVLAEQGQLTKDLVAKIDAGDEEVMRRVYIAQQQRIKYQANKIIDPEERQLTLSQIDSVQEVLDALREILDS